MIKVLKILNNISYRKWGILLILVLFVNQTDPTKSFKARQGFTQTGPSGEVVWMGGGSLDPTIAPGVVAPLGSIYLLTNGVSYRKTGALATDWEQEGLESDVVSQTSDFGKSGNAAANSYLNRSGNVPSNIAGIPVMPSSGKLKSVACSQENSGTWSIEFYEHDGNFVSPTLLYTLVVVSADKGSDHTLDVSVTQDKQLAAKALHAVKNVGCTVGIKGLSL